jgi:hypothetical protein
MSSCERGDSEPVGQVALALLGAIAAGFLGAAEEVGKLGVAVALGVLDVGLQAQRVAQALLGESDDVVVLVPGAGRLAGLFRAGLHRFLPRAWTTGRPRSMRLCRVAAPRNAPGGKVMLHLRSAVLLVGMHCGPPDPRPDPRKLIHLGRRWKPFEPNLSAHFVARPL